MSERRQSENRAIDVGLGTNMVLALLKTGFGIFGHSNALLADGINSTSDVAYCIVVKVFMFFSRKPPDREHPFGHGQLETIAALAVGSFVVTTAIALFWDAINSVYDIVTAGKAATGVGVAALWVALLTIGVKMVLTVYTRRVAARTGNAAILALARDHRNDIFSASGALAGILLSRAGCPWGDPLLGAVVALVVLATGIQILRESSADLMDTVPSEALEAQTHAILTDIPGLTTVEEVAAHRFGPYLVLNVTIGIEGSMTVREGDRIASRVERLLAERIALVRRVYVHYHPAGENGAGTAGSPLPDASRQRPRERSAHRPAASGTVAVSRERSLAVPTADWQAAVARAVPDPAVGIRLTRLGQRDGQVLLVASIPRQVGCHAHHRGDEVYEVVRGTGLLLYGPVTRQGGEWAVPEGAWHTVAVREGDAFAIPGGCAHQLRNTAPADGDLVILVQCPEMHLNEDRTLLAEAPTC